MKKRLLPIIVICLMLLFSACRGEGAETTVGEEITDAPVTETALTLVADGAAQYAVILPEESNGTYTIKLN